MRRRSTIDISYRPLAARSRTSSRSGTLYWKFVRPLHKHVLRRQLQALADWIEERADEHGTSGSPAAVTLQSDVR